MLSAAVGADEEGEKILAGLRHEGVNTSGVRVVAGARSAASVVVVEPLPLVPATVSTLASGDVTPSFSATGITRSRPKSIPVT